MRDQIIKDVCGQKSGEYEGTSFKPDAKRSMRALTRKVYDDEEEEDE
jgi:hypothetical protein